LLFIEWKEFSTLEFVKFIEENEAKYADIIFVIWWAYGVNIEKLKNNIDFKLSFSKMTFPHGQAIMMLLEQIYRVISIRNKSGYHH
jgi:23S rRNA (pseudouridine1915-N3)-methyltransferase